MKRAIVCVTNDLCTDQRVHKTCIALEKCGYQVTLYGRLLQHSFPLSRKYTTLRKRHIFNRGPLFYAEYNLRLFLFLLLQRPQLIWANDLDTLSAAFLASKIANTSLMYDTHEYFTETPELVKRPLVQKCWELIEKSMFSKIPCILTVNQSIATLYQQKYRKQIHVIRNIPETIVLETSPTKTDLQLPLDKKILIIQGAGINIDRGAEEACKAMFYLENCVLLIIGNGDVIPELKKWVDLNHLHHKILFRDRMDFKSLRAYTQLADLGLAIDKDTNINYRYSLPNKLFDYLHAHIPVLYSGLPELKNILETFDAGYQITSHDPAHLAQVIQHVFSNPAEYDMKKKNAIRAGRELNWEDEEKKLITIISTTSNEN